jgi:hypothetical protein
MAIPAAFGAVASTDNFKAELGISSASLNEGSISVVTDAFTCQIRFPEYAKSGHSVTMADPFGVIPASLLADVWQWY